MPPAGKRFSHKMRERRIFQAHASGMSDEEIARTEHMGPKAVRRVLARAGVDVQQVLANRKEQQMTKKKSIPRRDLEQLQDESLELIELTCGQEFQRLLKSGEIEWVAAERGIPYQDAFAQLQDEAYAPTVEAVRTRNEAKQRATVRNFEADEAAVNLKAEAYAERHNVGYEAALEAVLPGSTGPVQLEEKATAPVDADDEAINRRVQDHARREGCSYEVALEAILEDA